VRLFVLAILLSSCSPKEVQDSPLPDYGEMGAASDAGRVKSK
jgi:hypothetical protein